MACWSFAGNRNRAIAFYAVLAFSVLVGIGLNFTPLDPIKALYWSAVINGVLAPPVMVLMMLLVRRKKVMGELKIEGWLYWLGWLATATMALSIVGMAVSLVSGSFNTRALEPPFRIAIFS